MRITNNMLVNNMINSIGSNLVRMDKFQNRLATGKKIQVPSDDPVVAARALKLRTDVSEVDQYKRNVKDAQSWLEVTEGVLGNVGDVLHRARELAVQGSNGTLTNDDMKKISEEAKQLRTQLVHLSNSTYAGRYIFSGYKTDLKLMNDDGTFAIPVDNSEAIKYEIGIGDDININVAGGDLFNNGGAGMATGNSPVSSLTIGPGNDTLSLTVDGSPVTINITNGVYANIDALATEIQTRVNTSAMLPPTVADIRVTVVDNKLRFTSGSTGPTSVINIDETSNAAANLGLAATTETSGSVGSKGKLVQDFDNFIAALDAGDHDAVNDIIAELDLDTNNLLRVRADVGARVNRIELTANRLDNDNINFTKLMSENEDVDMAETIMNLKNEENVYRASLAGGARIIQPSLVDFLR